MTWNHFARVFLNFRSVNFLKPRIRGNSSSSPSSQNAPLPTLTKSTTPQMPSEAKDIIMYKYENPRFFKILNVFAIAQFGFWGFLCYSSISLVDVPVSKNADAEKKAKDDEDLPFWRKINLGQDKYKHGLAIGSFLMGYGILFISWTYILRSVRFLILRKDRKAVSFVTYTPFGQNRIMNVPLNAISAAGSRSGGTTQMPVKIKDRWLYYIIDLKDGHFVQPKLFDQTVGLSRKF